MWKQLVAVGSMLVASRAHADDCDFTDAASGSWTTAVAETIDQCMADPACAARAEHPPSPDGDPIDAPVAVPPPRARHGRFATGSAALGWITEGRTSTASNTANTGGELTARGQAGWHAGFQACGHTDLVGGTSSRGASGFSIAFPWAFWSISLGGEQQWQMRPALSASRVWLRRAYTTQDSRVGFALAVWRNADGSTGAAFPLRMSLRWQDQATADRAVFRTFRFAAFESNDGANRLEILPTNIEAMYPDGIGTDAAPKPPSSWLTRVDAIAFTHAYGDVTVDAGLGALFASDLSCTACLPVAGSIGFAWPAGGATWSVRAERSAHLAMDDRVTVEDRVSSGYERQSEHHTIRIAAFAAITRTTRDLARKPGVTGGSSVGVDIRLPEEILLAVDAEVARSYYGRLDADPEPTPELAMLGTVRLERRFNVNPTAHGEPRSHALETNPR